MDSNIYNFIQFCVLKLMILLDFFLAFLYLILSLPIYFYNSLLIFTLGILTLEENLILKYIYSSSFML